MKLKAECKVECDIYIPQQITISHDEKQYTFAVNELGLITSIIVVANVSNPELFESDVIETPNDKAKAQIICRTDSELLNNIRIDFQVIESLMSFEMQLSKINWREMKYDLICESEEEKNRAKILGFQASRKVDKQKIVVDANSLEKLVKTKDRYSSLAVPLAFFREGNQDFNTLRFINAFFNFYFIIEGIYGNRKTKNYAIEDEFKKSPTLRKAISGSMEFLKENVPYIYKRLLSQIGSPVSAPESENIIKYLVNTRGKLHHFTYNPNRLEGTPFTHDEFEPIAALVRNIAAFGIMLEVVKLNNSAPNG